MDNRPRGREKHVTGAGKDMHRRGEGLGGGPVGRGDGYQGRTESSAGGGMGGSAGGQRAGKGSPLGIIIMLAIMLLGGGGFGLNSLFGSEGDTSNTADTGDIGSVVQSMLGSYASGMCSGGGSVSTGWAGESNSGKLNTTVAPAAREKRTHILGNGQDVVTIMVYMCGTDLESRSGMATSDLQEMAKATIGSNVNLLVYTGGCKQWKNNVVSNRVNQIYKIENGKMQTLVKDDGNASLTKPSTLSNYIKYCTKNYPANRYELILWDHGGGSLSGYGYDEKNAMSGSMTLKGINEALAAAGTTFDFIGFDACLMATLETALMLDKYTDYLIASEETEHGVGWYYTNWLTALSQNTSMPTVEIGKNIVDDFVSVCNQRCNGQKTTLSVIDIAELSKTVPNDFKDFSASTSKLLKNNGYKTVSDARSNAREFAVSTKIDQIDLVHLAYNLGTAEGKKLAESILGAVKYNKTSPNMTNAYGLSIYFPYKRTSKVDSAVATYEAIGVDSEYSRCIQNFASLEVGGQAASGGETSPLATLLGEALGGSGSTGSITDILSGLMGGDLAGVSGLTSGNSAFLGRDINLNSAAGFISENKFDKSQLVWTTSNGVTGIRLSEKQWSLVHDLQLNVFFDDGEGYMDLGLDNVFEFTDDGALKGEYDGTWLAIDSQPVAYYYMDSVYEGDNYTITGRVPVLLNGDRANLIIVFDNEHPYGYIAGARFDYIGGETETVAKNMTELTKGDKIEFVCDYYSYDGKYQDSYLFGDPIKYNGKHEISNVYIDKDAAVATYLFTDIYNQEYWTSVIPE